MKKLLVIIVLCFMLIGCAKTIDNKGIDIDKLMKENEYIIVDVRTEEEYNESHIVGAINIPHDDINEYIKFDEDKIIFVYCESGIRSNIAFVRLTNYGYTVYNLGAFDDIDLSKE